MISERGKAGDRLTTNAEGGNAIGDHLFGVWDDLEDGRSQCLKGAALRTSFKMRVRSGRSWTKLGVAGR